MEGERFTTMYHSGSICAVRSELYSATDQKRKERNLDLVNFLVALKKLTKSGFFIYYNCEMVVTKSLTKPRLLTILQLTKSGFHRTSNSKRNQI